MPGVSTVRIALATLSFPASPEAAVSDACAAIGSAAAAGAALICFPECFVPGYRALGAPVPPAAPAWLAGAHRRVASAAGEAGIAVVLGTERWVGGRLRITAVVVGPDGGVLGWQDKVQLDPSEDSLYEPGEGRAVFAIDGLNFGIVICHEGFRYPETVRSVVRQGAQLVLQPHYSQPEAGSFRPERYADPRNTFHEASALCRAAENTCWYASVNCATAGSPTTSAVVRPDGTVLAWQPYGTPGLLVADLDLSLATRELALRLREGTAG
jgi:predicted amidohydrolase